MNISRFFIVFCSIVFLIKHVDSAETTSFQLNNDIYTLPTFDIDVTLTGKAQRQLKDFNERVKIAFYLSYNPKFNEERKLTKEEEKMLLMTQRELLLPEDGGRAFMADWKIPKIPGEIFAPELLINVVSARDQCEYNLLNCSIYQGPFPTKKRHLIKIKCDVIRDNAKCK